MLNSKNCRRLLLALLLSLTGAMACAAALNEQQAVATMMKIARGDTQALASLRQSASNGDSNSSKTASFINWISFIGVDDN